MKTSAVFVWKRGTCLKAPTRRQKLMKLLFVSSDETFVSVSVHIRQKVRPCSIDSTRTEALLSTFPSVSNEGTEEQPAPSHNSLRPNTDITQEAAGLFLLLFSSLESSFLSSVQLFSCSQLSAVRLRLPLAPLCSLSTWRW